MRFDHHIIHVLWQCPELMRTGCFDCTCHVCRVMVWWYEVKHLEVLPWSWCLLLVNVHWPASSYHVQYQSVMDHLRTTAAASECQFKLLTLLSPACQDHLNCATSQSLRHVGLALWQWNQVCHREFHWSSKSLSAHLVHGVRRVLRQVVAFYRLWKSFRFFSLVSHQLPVCLLISRLCIEFAFLLVQLDITSAFLLDELFVNCRRRLFVCCWMSVFVLVLLIRPNFLEDRVTVLYFSRIFLLNLDQVSVMYSMYVSIVY